MAGMNSNRLPALFLGHGSPMTLIADNPERRTLEIVGKRLPRPRAILCVTAHWETQGKIHLTSGSNPRTIHDFRGFPQELYDITYPAPGSDELVEEVVSLLGEDRCVADPSWGFDHGVWGVLKPLCPDADIPVVAMSLDRAMDAPAHFATGRALAPLRERGVLIVGSGNIVHNLRLWMQTQGTVPEWADTFRDRINPALMAGDEEALTRFAPDDEAALLAINSGEHYLPLLTAAGARLPGDEVAIFNDTVDGALSMTSVLIGDPAILG